jgi:hypothetical protein
VPPEVLEGVELPPVRVPLSPPPCVREAIDSEALDAAASEAEDAAAAEAAEAEDAAAAEVIEAITESAKVVSLQSKREKGTAERCYQQ